MMAEQIGRMSGGWSEGEYLSAVLDVYTKQTSEKGPAINIQYTSYV